MKASVERERVSRGSYVFGSVARAPSGVSNDGSIYPRDAPQRRLTHSSSPLFSPLFHRGPKLRDLSPRERSEPPERESCISASLSCIFRNASSRVRMTSGSCSHPISARSFILSMAMMTRYHTLIPSLNTASSTLAVVSGGKLSVGKHSNHLDAIITSSTPPRVESSRQPRKPRPQNMVQHGELAHRPVDVPRVHTGRAHVLQETRQQPERALLVPRH